METNQFCLVFGTVFVLVPMVFGRTLPARNTGLADDSRIKRNDVSLHRSRRWPQDEYGTGGAWWTKKSTGIQYESPELEVLSTRKPILKDCFSQFCDPIFLKCLQFSKSIELSGCKSFYQRCILDCDRKRDIVDPETEESPFDENEWNS